MQTSSCYVHVSNFSDKHFVTAEMKELIENEFRHPEMNESCHSVLMCSSKREGRNRLMYMSGPVHVSLDLKKSWGLVGIHMEVLSLLFGCYTNGQSLYIQVLSDLTDFSFCGKKVECQIKLLHDQDPHINDVFAHCADHLPSLEDAGIMRDAYRFLFVVCKQITYVQDLRSFRNGEGQHIRRLAAATSNPRFLHNGRYLPIYKSSEIEHRSIATEPLCIWSALFEKVRQQCPSITSTINKHFREKDSSTFTRASEKMINETLKNFYEAKPSFGDVSNLHFNQIASCLGVLPPACITFAQIGGHKTGPYKWMNHFFLDEFYELHGEDATEATKISFFNMKFLELRDMFKDSKYESSLYLLENIMCADWREWNGGQGGANNRKYDHIYATNYERELTSRSNPNCYFGKRQCTLQNIYVIRFLKGNYHLCLLQQRGNVQNFVPVQKYIELQNKYTQDWEINAKKNPCKQFMPFHMYNFEQEGEEASDNWCTFVDVTF